MKSPHSLPGATIDNRLQATMGEMRFSPHSHGRMDAEQGPRAPGAGGRSTIPRRHRGSGQDTCDISLHEGPGGVSPLARQKDAASQNDCCASTPQSNRVWF